MSRHTASRIWDAEIETLPRPRMEELQVARLRATVERVLATSTPLAERLRSAGIASGAGDRLACRPARTPLHLEDGPA